MKTYPPGSNFYVGEEVIPPDTSSGSSGVNTQDEGGAVDTPATTLNFVGAGVTATGGAGTTTVTIPGASAGNYGLVLATHMGYAHSAIARR